MNLLWRRGVNASLIARAFGIARNTLYNRALTGDPIVIQTIEDMGEDAAAFKYLDQAILRKINQAMKDEVDARE